MIYRIVVDGVDVFGNSEDMALLSPNLSMAVNEAGSLSFTVPHVHAYYDSFNAMVSDVDVYESGDLIWFGRILDEDVKLNKDKEIKCEGAFAFMNDSIQRPRSFSETLLSEIVESILTSHNSQVLQNRQISLGEMTIDDTSMSLSIDYSSTKDTMTSLRNLVGGYIMFRKTDGIIYLDWFKELSTYGLQPIQFGLNLIDISKSINGANIFTSIIPIGKEVDGVKTTISEENDGLDYLDSTYVEKYGRITKLVEFPDIASASELKTAALKWLEDNKPDAVSIKCDAAELYFLNNEYSPFRIGQLSKVISAPHDIDEIFPLISVNIKLDSAVKKVSVGTPDDRTISSITA